MHFSFLLRIFVTSIHLGVTNQAILFQHSTNRKMKRINRLRMLIFALMTGLTMCMLTACSSDGFNPEEGGGVQPEPEVFHPINASTRTLLDIVNRNEYTPSEFAEAIGSWPVLSLGGDALGKLLKAAMKTVTLTRVPQMDALFKERVGTAADGSRQWNIKRRVFTYKSISSVTGNDTTLVGSVIFPTNTLGKPHQVDVLTLYHHQACFEQSWLASQSVTMMALHALHNSAVIEPDGQGANWEIEVLVRENLQGDLTALQMADCVLAALEVMRQDGVTLADNGYSNNWGTSLGVTAATGFAQYMENDATPDLQALFNLRATYVGEGTTMLSQVIGYEGAITNPPKQKFYEGWNPRLPFYMSICKDDELINYDEMKKYYTQLRTMPDGSVNYNVHWYDFYMPRVVKKIINIEQIRELFGGTPVHLLSAILSLYDASIVKDPADMAGELDPDHEFTEE